MEVPFRVLLVAALMSLHPLQMTAVGAVGVQSLWWQRFWAVWWRKFAAAAAAVGSWGFYCSYSPYWADLGVEALYG